MAGKALCLMSFSTSEVWENDMESMQSSTRSAPSALAFSIEASISSIVSHCSCVHTSRFFLNAIIIWDRWQKDRDGESERSEKLREILEPH